MIKRKITNRIISSGSRYCSYSWSGSSYWFGSRPWSYSGSGSYTESYCESYSGYQSWSRGN